MMSCDVCLNVNASIPTPHSATALKWRWFFSYRNPEKPVCILFLFSPLGHPRFQVFPLMMSHSSRCSSLIPKITLLDKDDFGET